MMIGQWAVAIFLPAYATVPFQAAVDGVLLGCNLHQLTCRFSGLALSQHND